MVDSKRLIDAVASRVGMLSAAPTTCSLSGSSGPLSRPMAAGGANREGALDPETGILYIPSRTAISAMALANQPGSNLELSASLRAHDKKTGDKMAGDINTGGFVAEIELPKEQDGQPMTYMHDGKQFTAMLVSGSGTATNPVACALS